MLCVCLPFVYHSRSGKRAAESLSRVGNDNDDDGDDGAVLTTGPVVFLPPLTPGP